MRRLSAGPPALQAVDAAVLRWLNANPLARCIQTVNKVLLGDLVYLQHIDI
jgi:hypothetical protein